MKSSFPRKKPFILLEVLIGLFLTGLMLTLLFTSISHVVKVEKRIEKARDLLSSRQHVQMRLQDIFLSIETQASFYTQTFPEESQESLVAVFHHGIDPDPSFCGDLLFRLFVDRDKNLNLALWPVEDETLWRKEVLLADVKKVQFYFFGKKRAEEGALPSPYDFSWHKSWKKEREEPPLMIKLEITQKDTTIPFAFFIPTSFFPSYAADSQK